MNTRLLSATLLGTTALVLSLAATPALAADAAKSSGATGLFNADYRPL